MVISPPDIAVAEYRVDHLALLGVPASSSPTYRTALQEWQAKRIMGGFSVAREERPSGWSLSIRSADCHKERPMNELSPRRRRGLAGFSLLARAISRQLLVTSLHPTSLHRNCPASAPG